MQEKVVTIEQNVHLERLLTNDKEMQKKLQKAVRTALSKARGRLAREARSGLSMQSDPRAAYKAVKHTVYKRVLGGSVSILAKRRASNKAYRSDAQKERTGRGGNRLPRSGRTESMMSYYGSDRGFVLRFLNAGTAARSSRFGNRGSIMARNWFGPASQKQMMQAAEEIEKMIDQSIKEAEV